MNLDISLIPAIESDGTGNPMAVLFPMVDPECGCMTFYKYELRDENNNPINPPGFPQLQNRFTVQVGCAHCPSTVPPAE